MMMLKMMNPFGSVTDALPSVGGGDSEDSGQKQEDEREDMRQTIRDKYKIEKKIDSDAEEDDDDDDDFGGGPSKKVDDDPVAQAKAEAEKRMAEAKAMAGDKCSIQ